MAPMSLPSSATSRHVISQAAAAPSAAYPLDAQVATWDALVAGKGWKWLPHWQTELRPPEVHRAHLLGMSEAHLRRLQAAKRQREQARQGRRQR